MKNLKNSGDKIQEICDILRNETLLPAEKEAKSIIDQAHAQVQTMRHEAELEIQKRKEDLKKEFEQERKVFESTLSQASKQALESLRQSILEKLFKEDIETQILHESNQASLVTKLIEAVVKALDKEGLATDLSVFIPSELSPQVVCDSLTKRALEKLNHHTVEVGSFKGGAKVRLKEKNLTLDITDQALKELLALYLKKPEFRERIFKAE